MNQPIGIPSGWEICAAAIAYQPNPAWWGVGYLAKYAPGSLGGWEEFTGYDWRVED